jgi:type I restriction enzyme, S subunit
VSDLKPGWIRVRLEDVVEVNPRRDVSLPQNAAVSFVPMAAVDEATGEIVGATVRSFREVSKGFTLFKEGDVIFAKITPSMENGKAAVARNLKNGIGFGSTEFHVLRSKGAVTPEFIWYFLRRQSFRAAARDVMTGAVGQLRVPADYLKKQEFLVPPIAEQERIVEAIDVLKQRTRAVRMELAAVEKLLDQLKPQLLGAAVDGRLTAEWRRSNAKSFPHTTSLGEVCTEVSYGSAAKSAKTGKIPVLRMGNIQEGELDWSDLAFTSDDSEIERYALRAGDVLFNRTNSPELVGKTAVYSGERPAIFAGYLIRVRCSDRLNPRYLAYCLNSPMGRSYSHSVKSDGVSQSNINAQKLRSFRFLLPDISEQEEIDRQLSDVFKRMRGVASLAELVRTHAINFDEEIAERAFRGSLVPQNENDEPASLLVERLKISRQRLDLDSERLITKRQQIWNNCQKTIDQIRAYLAAHQNTTTALTSKTIKSWAGSIRASVDVTAPFSAVAKDCISTNRANWIMDIPQV